VATAKKPRSREKPEQIADELRSLIVSGELTEGDSLGREPDLVERFGVSRPSLREALRILEAEGLITVVRGVLGGVIVHEPNESMTARTAALLLQARNVTVGDVHQARSVIEPAAVRILAASARRKSVDELRALVEDQRAGVPTPGSTSASSASPATRR
jgi:GntR family transcriptional regulator, transcriptional repressor for pyruvate dehydrogenase complex